MSSAENKKFIDVITTGKKVYASVPDLIKWIEHNYNASTSPAEKNILGKIYNNLSRLKKP